MGSVACCYPYRIGALRYIQHPKIAVHKDENLRMRMKAELPDTIAGAGGHRALHRKDAETYGTSMAVLPFWTAM